MVLDCHWSLDRCHASSSMILKKSLMSPDYKKKIGINVTGQSMQASRPTTQLFLKLIISINIVAMEEAIAFLKSQDIPNYSAAARKFNVNAITLSRRFNGKTVSRSEAASLYKKQLTTPKNKQFLIA